ENQLILDDGYTNDVRKLYLRELIARFGYHNNIIWNIGEENGPQQSYWPQGQNDQQRFAMIRYLKDHDPYQHPVLVHTYPGPHERDHIVKPLLKFDKFDGLSMQIGDMRDVHSTILRWILESEENSRPWIVLMDELGPYHTGSKADYEDPDHDEIRKNVLWGALMAGAAGVEWYFGWENPPNDLNAEDWRSRNNLWEQSKVAKDFFSQIEYTRMRSMDSLISLGDNYCFAVPDDTYVIYLKNGSSTKLNLEGQKGEFQVFWYNPRKGGPFLRTEIKRIQGGTWCNLGFPPKNRYKDWVVLVKKRVP
ncbi:MAG: putative collagen-binding domain-containing protein, partial [Bacteroidota bacterium]